MTISILRVLSLLIPYLMYFRLPYYALAQSTSSISRSTVATSPTTSPSTTVYTGLPSLTFGNVPTMTACSNGLVLWNLFNEDPSEVNITLYAINEGIDQSIPSPPPSTTSPIAQTSRAVSSAGVSSQVAVASSPRPTSTASSVSSSTSSRPTDVPIVARKGISKRTILDLNITLVTQYANHGWKFDPVRLPEGRYYILGVVDDDRKTTNKSNVFSVVEDVDTSCLAAFKSLSASATGATATKAKPVTGKITSTATEGVAIGSGSNQDEEPEKKGISGGAIGGIVVGVIVGISALLLLLFCYKKRKRNLRDGNSEENGFRGVGVGKFGRNSQYGHSKMPSETTTPSDSDHNILKDKSKIAMTPVGINGSFKSDEKRDSINSLDQIDVVENLPGPNQNTLISPPISSTFTTSSSGGFSENSGSNNKQINKIDFSEDPFSTPTLGEIPTMSPIYSNQEIRKFGPTTSTLNHKSSLESTSTSTINPPKPVILANIKRSSEEEPLKRTTGTTLGFSPSLDLGKGLGLGLGLGNLPSSPIAKTPNTAETSSSLPYQQQSPIKSPSASDPGVKSTSLAGLGSPPLQNQVESPKSPDPNSFTIPSNTTPNGGNGGGLGRSASSRRKPVPSLGPELRTELARQGSLKDLKKGGGNGNGNSPENTANNQGRRRSYKLMPDPPIIHE